SPRTPQAVGRPEHNCELARRTQPLLPGPRTAAFPPWIARGVPTHREQVDSDRTPRESAVPAPASEGRVPSALRRAPGVQAVHPERIRGRAGRPESLST